MRTNKRLILLWPLILLSSGCSAPVTVEPFAPVLRQLAEVSFALSAAAISMQTNQTAGRDMTINDPWVVRGLMAAGTLIFYMTFVRPVRNLIVRRIKNGG